MMLGEAQEITETEGQLKSSSEDVAEENKTQRTDKLKGLLKIPDT